MADWDDFSAIEYIRKFYFSAGFQGFRIKWPLKNLRPKISPNIETKVMGDGLAVQDLVLSWSLEISNRVPYPSNEANSTERAFSIRLRRSSDANTPIIYHASLSSSTNTLLDWNGLAVMDGNPFDYGVVPSSQIDRFPVKDLVLQFCIQIPEAIFCGWNIYRNVNAIDFNDLDTFQKKNNDAYLSAAAKIFDRVTETEATDKSSDVSIVIVKKVEESRDGQIIEKKEEIRRFHCHVVLLSARSTVFEALFAEEKWAENRAENGRLVEIVDDIDAEIMETVLRHIYTSALPDPSTEEAQLFNIIYAADKYDLTELKNWCISILILKHGSAQSRIDQLILADRHNLEELKSVCLAQLSMSFPVTFSNHTTVKDIPSDLWKEIMKAIGASLATTTNILLPEA